MSAELDSLEEIATVALEFGQILMEGGTSARLVEELVQKVARGLGADWVDLRIGYASLSITVGRGEVNKTRLRKLGALGVNQAYYHQLRDLAERVGTGPLRAQQTLAELERVIRETPGHPLWFKSVAVGVACAAFGRLLGVDWTGALAVLVAATLGQYLRGKLHHRGVNVFITAAVIAFVTAFLGSLGATLLHSNKVDTAMISSVLLLVPGLPLFLAQTDILEGRPTLGAARAIWVAEILIFLTAGLWLAAAILGRAA